MSLLRSESDPVKIWSGSLLDMVWLFTGYGLALYQIWSGSLLDMVWLFTEYGAGDLLKPPPLLNGIKLSTGRRGVPWLAEVGVLKPPRHGDAGATKGTGPPDCYSRTL